MEYRCLQEFYYSYGYLFKGGFGMENISKLISDIFSMKFDVVIPLSGCIIAIFVGLVLFLIRYVSYTNKKKKFSKMQEEREKEKNV